MILLVELSDEVYFRKAVQWWDFLSNPISMCPALFEFLSDNVRL